MVRIPLLLSPCFPALTTTLRWFSLLSFVNFRFVILGLDADYEWFIAGNPRRQSLWVLSRRPHMSPELWAQALRIASRCDKTHSRIFLAVPSHPHLSAHALRCA